MGSIFTQILVGIRTDYYARLARRPIAKVGGRTWMHHASQMSLKTLRTSVWQNTGLSKLHKYARGPKCSAPPSAVYLMKSKIGSLQSEFDFLTKGMVHPATAH